MADFPPTAGFIDSLDPANPINDNKVFGGDDWFRFVQQVLKNQFPKDEGGGNNGYNIECTAKCSELNTLTGISTSQTLEDRLTALENGQDPIARITPWPIAEANLTQTLSGSLAPGKGTWHLCDGTNLDGSTTYADLFAVIANQFGGTDAASMLIPDIQGRVIAGRGTGVVLTGYREGVNDNTQGNTGGEQAHTQAADELFVHTHTQGTYQIASQNVVVQAGGGSVVRQVGGSGSTGVVGTSSASGGVSAQNAVQPTIILAWYIRVL